MEETSNMNYPDYMKSFDAVKIKNEIVEWIKEWFANNGSGCNAIIGISGGKDSSIVAALCVEALGKDRVLGVLMPQGEQADICDAYTLVNHLGIDNITVDIQDSVSDIICSIYNGLIGNTVLGKNFQTISSNDISEQSRINLPPRIRMSTLYAVSQSFNGRVANTCNLSEDYVGYSTRWGDSVGDFSPISNLTTDEVIAVGLACGLPKELVIKTPADGLCGKTDEDNLGFSYSVLNEYIRTGVCEDEAVKNKIDILHNKNLFKMQPIPSKEWPK